MAQALKTALNAALKEVFASSAEDFTLDANDMVAIGFEEGVTVALELNGEGDAVLLRATVCAVDSADAGALRLALEINLFRLPTEGSWLAFDPTEGGLVLCQLESERMRDAQSLAAVLKGVVANAVSVRAQILAAGQGTEAKFDWPVDEAAFGGRI